MKRKMTATLAALAMVLVGVSAPASAATHQAKPSDEIETKMPEGKPPAVKKISKKNPNERKREPLLKGNPGVKGNLKYKESKKATTYLTPGTPPVYSYSGSQQLGLSDPADGFGATILVSSPYFYPGDGDTTCSNGKNHHTLVELSARDSNDNVVEVGWQKAPCETGDNNPHLFVYSWVNGTGQGYNGDGGFLDAVGCNPCAGDSLSGAVNTNKQFGLNYVNDGAGGATDGWWASYNSVYIGVWPDSVWTGQGQTFTTATDLLPYAEITSEYVDSCSDMGSGYQGGTSNSTAIQSLTITGSTDAANFDASTYTTNSNAWPIATVSDTYIRPGGKGYNSVGGDTGGATGSCAPASAGTPAASTFQLWAEFCPDNQTSTGCNNVLPSYTTANAGLNVCVALSSTDVYTNGPSQYDTTVFQNNSGVSGRSYRVWATSGCTGATQITIGNGGSGNPSFEPHAIQRIG